MVKLWGR